MASADHEYTIHFLEGNKTIMVGDCCTVININIDKEAYDRMSERKGGLQSSLSFEWSDFTPDEKVITKVVKLNVINLFEEFYLDVDDGFVDGKFALTREFIERLYKRYRARLLKIRHGCIALDVGFSDMASFNQFREKQAEVCKLCEDFLTKCCKRDVAIRLEMTIQDEDLSMDYYSLPKRHETGYTRDLRREEKLKGDLEEEQQKTLQKLRELVYQRAQHGMSQERDPSKDWSKEVETLKHPSGLIGLPAAGQIVEAYVAQRDDEPSIEEIRKVHADASKQSEPSADSLYDSGVPVTTDFLPSDQHISQRDVPFDLRAEQSQVKQEELQYKPTDQQLPEVEPGRTPREYTIDLRSGRQSRQESPADAKVPLGQQTSSGLHQDVSGVTDEDAELYELQEEATQPHSEDVGGKLAETANQSEPSFGSVSDSSVQSSEKFQSEQHRMPREYTIDLRSDRQSRQEGSHVKSPIDQEADIKVPLSQQTSSGLHHDVRGVTDEDAELYGLQEEGYQSYSEDVGGIPAETAKQSEPSLKSVGDSGFQSSEKFPPQHQRTPREYQIDLRSSLGRRRQEEQAGQQSALREDELSLSPAQPTSTGSGPEAVKREDKSGDDVHQSGKKRHSHAVESSFLSSLQVEVAGKSERTVAQGNLSDKFENPKLPPLGTRVIRGKDWKYGGQDADGPGTIYAHDKLKNYVWVLWDGGRYNCYRYNRKKAFDVKTVENQPRRPSSKHSFEIGVRVRPVDPSTPESWPSHTEAGVVIRRDDSGTVMVRWSNGKMTEHHSEQGRIRDIAICNDDIPEEASPRIPSVQDLSRSPQTVKEKTKNIWRWRDKGGNWHCYPQRLQETIEQEYQKKPSGSFLIRKSKKSFRIHGGSMEEEDLATRERLPVDRQAVDADEYEALIPVE